MKGRSRDPLEAVLTTPLEDEDTKRWDDGRKDGRRKKMKIPLETRKKKIEGRVREFGESRCKEMCNSPRTIIVNFMVILYLLESELPSFLNGSSWLWAPSSILGKRMKERGEKSIAIKIKLEWWWQ